MTTPDTTQFGEELRRLIVEDNKRADGPMIVSAFFRQTIPIAGDDPDRMKLVPSGEKDVVSIFESRVDKKRYSPIPAVSLPQWRESSKQFPFIAALMEKAFSCNQEQKTQ